MRVQMCWHCQLNGCPGRLRNFTGRPCCRHEPLKIPLMLLQPDKMRQRVWAAAPSSTRWVLPWQLSVKKLVLLKHSYIQNVSIACVPQTRHWPCDGLAFHHINNCWTASGDECLVENTPVPQYRMGLETYICATAGENIIRRHDAPGGPMKAVRLHGYHQDTVIEDVPEPQINGPWDVIVDVGAAGLRRPDVDVIEGQWEPLQKPALQCILGHEHSGWAREVGSAVTNVSPGDTVIIHPLTSCGLCPACRIGEDSHCENATFPGLNVDGGMAEQLLTNARAVVKLERGTDPKAVAALADAGLTAYHAVRKAAGMLFPGTHAVVIGAGGLGHIGIQTLRALT